jgi:hypothetical protein
LAQFAVDNRLSDGTQVNERDATFHHSSRLLDNHPDGARMLRLTNMANIIVRFPGLRGISRRIFVNMPVDVLLDWLNKLLYFIFYYRKLNYNMGWVEAFKSGFFLFRRLVEFN